MKDELTALRLQCTTQLRVTHYIFCLHCPCDEVHLNGKICVLGQDNSLVDSGFERNHILGDPTVCVTIRNLGENYGRETGM